MIVGRDGQLARSLAARAGPEWDLRFLGREECDLLRPDAIGPLLDEHRPFALVNTAAFTAVDRAEEDEAPAQAINGEAPGALARAAAARDIPFVHLSTDYVFDGSAQAPLDETAPTAPINAYGRTKLAGEQAVSAAGGDSLVIRTAWLFSPFGRNFVRTMLDLAGTRESIRVVADQYGNPTSAIDLADGILAALSRRRASKRFPMALAHLAGSHSTNWSGLAEQVMQASAASGGPTADIIPIASSEYPARAPRPLRSSLDSRRFAQEYRFRMPDWSDAVARDVAAILA